MYKTLAAAALAAVIYVAPAQAVVFDFEFDSSPNTALDAIVGTGSLSFDDPGIGTFDFFALTNVSFTADFGAEQFSLSDIVTTVGTTVILSGTPGSRTLVFSGVGNAPGGGSVDFLNGGNDVLSFQPNASPLSLALYFMNGPSNEFFGNYLATEQAVIPLPATLPLALAGIAGLGFLARRR